jgi:Fur family transcriptional regulator, peroxide stress response regulator
MKAVPAQERRSKYCSAIEEALQRLSHATNAQLLAALREVYPELSATTIHRATARLMARGKISVAPPALDGAVRYDVTTTPHDHFVCSRCGLLRDANVKGKIAPILEDVIEGCSISGRLTISGLCKRCNTESKQEDTA